MPRDGYAVPMPRAGRWIERVNTDAANYGGSGRGNLGMLTAEPRPWGGQPAVCHISLPPLATLILEYEAT